MNLLLFIVRVFEVSPLDSIREVRHSRIGIVARLFPDMLIAAILKAIIDRRLLATRVNDLASVERLVARNP